MKKEALIVIFRHGVLGALLCRNRIERGELKKLIGEAASRDYDIPGSRHTRIAEKTIEDWYYKYQRDGLDGLRPKERVDKGMSKLSLDVQEAIIQAKKENPKRSIDAIIDLLESKGVVAKGEVSRSSVHRLLKQHGISRMSGSAGLPEEFRSFETQYAGQIWYGDVMHGPMLMIDGRMRKVYLVSLMDDASRLLAHSAFCLGETALDIEGVLKQAVLKRGVPVKLDELFYHRVSRKVRRDGTVAWNGNRFEVDYVLAGKQVQLVIDSHAGEALRVEDENGEVLSMVIPLDVKANAQRKRRKPEAVLASDDKATENAPMQDNLVEMALEQYTNPLKGGN